MSPTPNTDPDALKSEELEVRAMELQARRLEATNALASTKSPWRRRLTDPLVLAILGGVVALLGNMAVEWLKAVDDQKLTKTKAQYDLLMRAVATDKIDIANRNVRFFIDAGLLEDGDCKISEALERDQPVLPSLSGTAPPTPAGMHNVPEIMTLYNFPPGYDGRGQTIGLIQLGGNLISKDLTQYFKSLNLPTPDVSTVSIDGASYKPGTDADNEVMINVEIIGSIAPRAHVRVYFAPNSAAGYADAVKQAMVDHVSVLGSGWGSPESAWKDEEINMINALLETAAEQGMTVLLAANDLGVTDGMRDGRPHVDFPTSSPWVLSIGGTTLNSEGDRITSETVYKDASNNRATGGGFSKKFPRPDWQSSVPVPAGDDAKFGRGIPDVVASADPKHAIPITVHGRIAQIGGTSGAMPLWAGLIALINQALGYDVGYLNRRLYQEMGPAGVFRAVTSGDNGVAGVKGYAAGPGWTPVAGWGSPDGMKLLTWLRAHPGPNRPNTTTHTACHPSAS
jgi:kumamolisin